MEKFGLGTVECAPKVENALAQWGQGVSEYIKRHASGDWGECGLFDMDKVTNNEVRDRAALLLLFDLRLAARDVTMLEVGDIDFAADTVFARFRQETRGLSAQVKTALDTWIRQGSVTSGRVFHELEVPRIRNLVKSIMNDGGVANTVAILLERGTVLSYWLLEPLAKPSGFIGKLFQSFRTPQRHQAMLVIQTVLDSPQRSIVDLTDDPRARIQMSVKSDPDMMFGPERVPFGRFKLAVS